MIVLLGVIVLACAACGGGAKQSTRGGSLPASLLKQIKAEIQQPSVIVGASSARTVEVYGPASHSAIEKASAGSASSRSHVAGDWYLIVLRGHFSGNVPVPPGAKEPTAKIAMEVWSPTGHGRDYSFPKQLPAAVSLLHGPAKITLS